MIRSVISTVLLAAVIGLVPAAAARAQSQDYFIPGQGQGQGQAHRPAAAPRPAPSRQARGPAPAAVPPSAEDAPVPQLQLPPAPDIPALPRGASAPAAVMGVIGVPDIMRVSTAYQEVDKLITQRRDKLNEDAQKEQSSWRDMEQSLASDRAKLSPDQIRAREHDLQERITKAQKAFRERGNILQAQAQYGQAQIERALVGIIQRVAESRGMNIVLHRQLVALNVPEFDITEECATQLNKVLPSIGIPADGQMPPLAQAGNGKSEPGKADQAKSDDHAAPAKPAQKK